MKRRKQKRLTPKQKVLKKWPNAYCTKGFGFYAGLFVIKDIFLDNNCYSNHARSPNGAWADAARRLK